MNKQILLIDDDRKLIQLLSEYLSGFNYRVISTTHPKEGLNQLRSNQIDLIILDVMLPDINGFELCKMIREISTVPIIMLTARGDVTDRIVGIELGADDYLPKPFEPRELVARIQSIFRRENHYILTKKIQIKSLTIDTNRHLVILNNNPIDLTTMEYEVLLFFTKNLNRVLNRDQIVDHLKGIDWDPYNRSVDILISRLRQKLNDDPKNPKYIKTIWGVGYLFIGDTLD